MRINTLSLLSVTLLFIGCQQESASTNIAKPNDTTAQSDSVESLPPDEEETTVAVAETEQEPASTNHGSDDHDDHRPGMGGPGHGMGRGRGRGMGRGGGFRPDMTTIHAMFAAKEKITRTIKMLPTGAEALTESDDKEIAALIQKHVPAMETRVFENAPLPPMTFHPVFQELIKHADDYTFDYEVTDRGIKVTYQAEDPFVIMLVQEHSKLVSRFLKNGMSEIHKPYELPKVKDADKPATEQ